MSKNLVNSDNYRHLMGYENLSINLSSHRRLITSSFSSPQQVKIACVGHRSYVHDRFVGAVDQLGGPDSKSDPPFD
jgi:hypothetical protein